MRKRSHLLLILWPCLHAGVFSGPLEVRLQVATGQGVQELGDGSVIESILDSSFGDGGHIAFSAEILMPTSRGPGSRWALYLKDSAGLKRILLDGDPLPGGEMFSFRNLSTPPVFAVNQGGAVMIGLRERGILLYQGGQLRWLVRSGSNAPGISATFQSSSFSRRALNHNNEVVFQAQLSDGTHGVFLVSSQWLRKIAAAGDPVPARAGLKFETMSLSGRPPILSGTAIAFMSPAVTTNRKAIFVSGPGGLQTVTMTGDPVAGTSIRDINEFDVNAKGQVAFVASVARDKSSTKLFFWSEGTLQTIASAGDQLPGFAGRGPNLFSNLSLDDRGRLFFAAQVEGTRAGFYIWNGKEIEKAIVDGEPSPVGGTFQLGYIPYYFSRPASLEPAGHPIPPILSFLFSVTRMNGSLEFAFSANLPGSELGGASFVWRAGLLEPIKKPDAGEIGLEDRLVSALTPVGLNEQGTVLLNGSLCCTTQWNALFVSEPPGARIQFLPLVAAGEASGFRYLSQVELSNRSPFSGFVFLELFDSSGNVWNGSLPKDLILEAGEIRQFTISDLGLRSGYLKMRVEGGADIALSARVQLWRATVLESQTSVSAQSPITSAVLILDRTGSANVGLALSNPSDSPVRLKLRLVDEQGRQQAERSLELTPRIQSSAFVEQIFANAVSDFLGTLEVASESSFLLSSLRFADLQLSAVPFTLPRDLQRRTWEFVNILPGISEQRLVNGPGNVAVVSGGTVIKIITDEGPVTVLNRNTILPGTGTTLLTSVASPVKLLDFNNNNELIFFAHLEGGSRGLFLWRGKFEKVVLHGEVVGGRKIQLETDPQIQLERDPLLIDAAALNDRGLVAFRTLDGIFVFDGALRRVISATDTLPGSSIQWGAPRSVDVSNTGVVVFTTLRAVARWDGTNLKVIADPGTQPVNRQVRMTEFIRARVTGKGTIFFTASNRDSGIESSGLFIYDGSAVRLLAMRGDPLSGRPGTALGFIDTAEPAIHPRFQVNDNNRAVLLVNYLRAGDEFCCSGRGFVHVDEAGQIQVLAENGQLLPEAPLDPFGHIDGWFEFRWNHADQLLFMVRLQRLARTFEGIFLWEKGKIRKVIQQGDRISPAGAQLALVRNLSYSLGLTDAGLPVFEAAVAGEGITGTYKGMPGSFREHFLPHAINVALGSVEYRSKLLLHNKGSEQAQVFIDLFFASEAPPDLDWTNSTLTPGETKTFDLPFPFAGWTRIRAVGGAVQVIERISVASSGKLVSQVAVPGASLVTEAFLQASTLTAAGTHTGVALANPYNEAAFAELELIGSRFRIEERTTVSIPAKGQRAFLLSELFPNRQFASGLVRVRTARPLPLIALRLEGLMITSIPISQ